MTTELIFQPKQLRLDDLPFLQALGHLDGDQFLFDHSPKGYKLKTPVTLPTEKILAVGQKGLVEYIVTSLISQRPTNPLGPREPKPHRTRPSFVPFQIEKPDGVLRLHEYHPSVFESAKLHT